MTLSRSERALSSSERALHWSEGLFLALRGPSIGFERAISRPKWALPGSKRVLFWSEKAFSRFERVSLSMCERSLYVQEGPH